MPNKIEFIYDDRALPPPDIETIVGKTRFSDVLRRRARLVDNIRAETAKGGCTAFHHLRNADDARAIKTRIEDGPLTHQTYLRMPSCLGPLDLSRLSDLCDKSRFTDETTFIGAIFRNEAMTLLDRADAIALLSGEDDEARRSTFIQMAETADTMYDHLELLDLRVARNFLKFMTGSTEARHFNALKIQDGVLTKTSSDIAKLKGEHGFFHAVPEQMKRFLIPTFDYTETSTRASYSMEHLVVPDAALQVVHHALSPENFETLIDRFFDFCAARATRAVGAQQVREVGRKQILDKMTARLETLRSMEEGERLNALLRDGGPMGDLAAMEARSTALINTALEQDTSDAVAVSHGDPCFSNILFDRRTGLFRLIDPRGSETPGDAEMHPLYDIAKFSHSILGNYDFVNSDLFDVVVDDQLTFRFSIDGQGTPATARTAFKARLEQTGLNLWVVRAYELSLFMSMLPLHSDHPRKLLGFAMIACQLIEYLENTAPRRRLF